MRVLHVIARLNAGGTARYLEVLSEGLSHAGVEHLLAIGNVQGNEPEDDGVLQLPVWRLPHMGRAVRPGADYVARRELDEVIEAFKPSIIHTHTFKAGVIGRSVSAAIPHVHTFHGFSVTDPEFRGIRGKAMVLVERYLAARRTQQLVAVSHDVVRQYLRVGVGESERDYAVIPPGVRPPTLIAKAAARQALSLPQNVPIVVWLARFAPAKGPERVLELASRFPDAVFLMAGDGPLLDEVRSKAPRNVYLPGWIDASTALSAGDIALLTSHSEGLGIAIVEAQLAGLPVVATAVGGVPEVVQHEMTGLLAEPERLGDALGALLRDETRRTKMGNAGRHRCERLFAPSTVAERHIELYRQISSR